MLFSLTKTYLLWSQRCGAPKQTIAPVGIAQDPVRYVMWCEPNASASRDSFENRPGNNTGGNEERRFFPTTLPNENPREGQ